MQAYNYVQFATMLCSIMLASIFFAAWYSFGRKAHALAWSMAFSVGAVQWMWNCFFHGLPTKASYWMIVTSLSAVILNLALWGFISRAGWRDRTMQQVLAAVAVQAAVFWFTGISKHTGIQTAVPVLYGAALLLIIAWMQLRVRPKPYPAEWGIAVVALLFAISQTVAAYITIQQGAGYDPRYVEVYNAVNFLILPSAYIGLGMFAMFILATDLSEDMKKLAMTDQLTGCLNRRGFYASSDQLVSYALRSGLTLTVISCDLDYFKQVNDAYGHDTGDKVIIKAAEVLENNLRGQDIVGRIGGEEFALLLIDCPIDIAEQIANRIREQIREATIMEGDQPVSVTASLGVAPVSPLDYSIEQALIVADRALYDAKGAGRDRVITAH